MKTALLPGSFDPPTLGHLDLIQRASKLCTKLYIGIGHDPSLQKSTAFTLDERKELLYVITKDIQNIEILTFSGLVTDFAKKSGIECLIRGLRSSLDFEYELRMAFTNRRLTGIDTIFLIADERYALISSSLIREVGRLHGNLKGFVPALTEETVRLKLSQS